MDLKQDSGRPQLGDPPMIRARKVLHLAATHLAMPEALVDP